MLVSTHLTQKQHTKLEAKTEFTTSAYKINK